MAVEGNTDVVREAVGIFHDPRDLEAAIDDLLSSGFDRAELSLLASEHAIQQKLGHRYEKVERLVDDPVIPRAAFVSTEAIGDAKGGLIGGLLYVGATVAAGAIVASGGAIATAIIGSVLAGGAGGLLGAILAKWLDHHHASYLQEQVERGGLLLWVRTMTASDEERALKILQQHAGEHVHVHGKPLSVDRVESAIAL
jgi:hypothetical protein